MSQRQPDIAHPGQIPAGVRPQNDLAFDLIVMEAGLRLKVLPIRDAIIRGQKLNLSAAERRTRRCALFSLCQNAQIGIVDIGLFADAVARRPDIAIRMWRALHPLARR